jgi:hypothetical protein
MMRAKLVWPVRGDETPRSLALFSGLFLAAGIALLVALLLLPAYRSYMARTWKEVPCTILTSGVESESAMQSSTTFRIAITYSYVVNGREYTGNRYNFFPKATIGYRRKAEAVRQYPSGSQRMCLVDPNDPARAVLTRRLGPGAWLGALPLLFVVGGGFGVIHAVRQVRERSRTEKANPYTTSGTRRSPT